MQIRDTLIISLAIIASGYMVADSLKPVQAFGDGNYAMMQKGDGPLVWVLNGSGEIKLCGIHDGQPSCTEWSE